jgi:predicted TIM-barrel fold metal-dependent hydrolase
MSPHPGNSPAPPLTVVSADSHVGPTLEELRPYCERRYLADFDGFLSDYAHESNGGPSEPKHEQSEIGPNEQFARFGVQPSDLQEALAEADKRRLPNAQGAGSRDVEQRHFDMDFDGVAADVIFHGTLDPSGRMTPMPFNNQTGPSLISFRAAAGRELEAEGRRIYNRWLAEFCASSPERHAGLCQVPIWDLDESIKTVEWAAANGLCGVNFPSPQSTLPPYEAPEWQRFFGACAKLEMPLVTHVGGSTLPPFYEGPAAFAINVQEFPFTSGRNLWQMILSGTFDRHPTLKLVITEVPGTWFVNAIRDMDGLFEHRGSPVGEVLRLYLTKRPSDYVRSNVYLGVSFMAPHEAHAAVSLGLTSRVMWGSDYPHPEGTWMYFEPDSAEKISVTRMALANAFAGLELSDIRRMIGENAIDCYGLDRGKLSVLARRIGPTVDNICTSPDLSAVPENYMGLAFRNLSAFS